MPDENQNNNSSGSAPAGQDTPAQSQSNPTVTSPTLAGNSQLEPTPAIVAPTPPAPAPKHAKRLLWVVVFVVVLALLAGGGWYWWHKHKTSSQSTTSQNSSQHLITVGTTIDENGAKADRQEYSQFVGYLADQLHSQGITGGQFLPENSVADIAQLMREDKLDVYIDSDFPVFVANKLAGSQAIADRWKEGVASYRSVVFVKKSSPIVSASDLVGHVIAFDSSTSTAGYFMLKATLIQQGYKLVEVASPTSTVPAGHIGYTFVHGQVYDDVQNGVTPAGGESEQEIQDHFGNSFATDYREVDATPYVDRFLVAVRGDMSPAMVNDIKSILFNMDQSTKGKQVLASFSNTAKFTSVNSDSAYGVIEGWSNLVQDEIVQGGLGATGNQ